MYSIDYIIDDDIYIFAGNESTMKAKKEVSEFIKLKNNSWKLLYQLMTKVEYIWRINKFSNELTIDFQNFSKDIFSKLKSCEENMTFRDKNFILENDINTEYQILLYDILYEEQELYSFYDEVYKQKKLGMKFKSKNELFKFLLKNYQNLFKNIYNDNQKINSLKKLRWYILFDEDNLVEKTLSNSFLFNNESNYNNNFCNKFKNNNINFNDSFNEEEKDIIYNKFINNDKSLNINNDIQEYKEFILNEKIIDNLLNKEENPILYLVKLIYLTIAIFCKETMCYLNTTYDKNNSSQLIKEYIKRFNNFIQAAKYINKRCENLNIVLNYLDKDILKTYPHFPKFSIFRLCIKIWYIEMSTILTEDNTSLFSKIKQCLLNLFSQYLNEDLINNNINDNNSINFHNEKNISFKSSLFNSDSSTNLIFSESQISKNTNFSLKSSIFFSDFNVNSVSNNQTLANTLCPLGSLYEDNDSKYLILEKSFDIIYETFLDEYTINLFNLSYIDTNNYYEKIENEILELIELGIKKIFVENIINKNNDNTITNMKIMKDNIINYFRINFYNKRIINKLKKRIYSYIVTVLKKLIFGYIINQLKNNSIISINNKNNTNLKIYQEYITELNNYLSLNDKIDIENELYKVNFIENIFEIISDIDKWLDKETKNINNLDKKVIKELDKKNISSNYNNLQKYLLSYSVRNNWEIITKIKNIENYHIKINKKEEKKNKIIKNAFVSDKDQNSSDDDDNMDIDDLKRSNIFF